ncbi:MAG: acylphosphatase [Armatimonadota bacterium]
MAESTDSTRRLEARVHGRVQGVGFRYFTQREAQKLGLSGWVRNLRSGEVEIAAEGSKKDLQAFLSSVRKGPPMAWVERVDENWREAKGESGSFEVAFTT